MNEITSTESDQSAVPTPSAAKYREFAADAGLTVGARGVIPREVRDAFSKAPKRTQKKYL